jgi:hypothetical protein
MKVEPEIIEASSGATISHTGNETLVVTIEGDHGQLTTVEVPPNTTVHWMPPAGWGSAAFSARNHDTEYRVIDQEAVATSRLAIAAKWATWGQVWVAAGLAFTNASPSTAIF